MTYGGTVPTITASFSGFPSGQSASNLTGLTCSAAVTSTSIVGTYESNCSGVTNANYKISYGSGTVTVNPATLTRHCEQRHRRPSEPLCRPLPPPSPAT